MSELVPLHVKSDSSLGQGVATVEELAARAAELGYRALALTDLENLYGQVRFHHACRAHGVRAITGVELRAGFDPGRRRPGALRERVVLIARDRAGYRSLCRIVSERRTAERGSRGGPSRSSPGQELLDQVERHAEGLLLLSDAPLLLERLASRRGVAREQLGALLVRPGRAHESEVRLIEVARRLGVPLCADLDVVLGDREQEPLLGLLASIREHRRFEERGSDGRWLRPREDAAALFADQPGTIPATARIVEACDLDLTSMPRVLPAIDLTGRSLEAELRARCDAALDRRGREARYAARLDQELSVIEALGLSGYFLVVSEIALLARELEMLAVGRGSAGCSLCVHLLGASPIDPLAHGLFFERFLHEGKREWPDIDLDLPSHRRDELVERACQHFGAARVAIAAAHTRFQIRSALREGLGACGAARRTIEAVLAGLPPEELDQEVDLFEIAERVAPAAALSDAPLGNRRHLPMLPLIERLIGRLHHVGAHPGGLVIADRAIADHAPLEIAPKGIVITQYDAEALGRIGMVKIDLLGSRALSELEEAIELAGAGAREPLAPLERGEWQALPWSDPATLARIDRADTIGCFQLESPAMRSLLVRIPIRSLEELCAALALIRPGAAAADAKSAFVRRAHGEESPEPVDPRLRDRLAATHGLLLYEEDVMALLATAGGLSLAEADELRAAIVREGDDPGGLAEHRAGFLSRAPRFAAGAERAWETATRFAAYSFNKAHAVSHAQLAFLSAYLREHLPVELACALINHHQGLYPLRTIVGELIRSGIQVLPPHVNRSRHGASLEYRSGDRAVRVGLDQVHALPGPLGDKLIREREAAGPFSRLGELCARVPLRGRALEALVLSGACDGLSPLAADGYPFLHEAALAKLRSGASPEGLVVQPAPGVDPARIALYRVLVRVRNELVFLGMHLTCHPMAALRPEAERAGCIKLSEAPSRAGATVGLAATVAALRRVATRKGPMAFLTLEDESAILEAVAFPPVYRRIAGGLGSPGPFLVSGRILADRGAIHLVIAGLKPFHARRRPFGVDAT